MSLRTTAQKKPSRETLLFHQDHAGRRSHCRPLCECEIAPYDGGARHAGPMAVGSRGTQTRLALICVALVGLAWLASCGKPETPSPKVELPPAAAPTVDTEMESLVGEVYVYAYPLVLTDVTRAVDTASLPIDTFRHEGTLPDASSTDVANPNADFLYSQAWLDLSDGPVILTTPDTRGRYYLIAMLGAWTNVVASLGTRTTGDRVMPNAPTDVSDLKTAPPRGQVTAISHCGDTYRIKTADGRVNKIAESDLRFRTDSSNVGPRPGKPVIVDPDAQGSPALIVFAAPSEISSLITESCPLRGDEAPF